MCWITPFLQFCRQDFPSGCPKYLIFLLRNYLMDRNIQISINNYNSWTFHSEKGVPQGFPLATLFSKIYFMICTMKTMNISILIYTCGSLFMTQPQFPTIIHWSKSLMDYSSYWAVKMNPDKSQLIIFNHKISPKSPKLGMENNFIVYHERVKYLALTIDHKLTLKTKAFET